MAPVFKLMLNSMEKSTAAAALVELFYHTGDNTADHNLRDEKNTQGSGPLRRTEGASSPIKKMVAVPYGHQVNPPSQLTLHLQIA
jgi:hypothetical protein